MCGEGSANSRVEKLAKIAVGKGTEGEREREIERERERERESKKERKKQTNKQTNKQSQRKRILWEERGYGRVEVT